ncbi:MAG: hypothetical protein ACO1TH_15340 [Luteitalea sp.]
MHHAGDLCDARMQAVHMAIAPRASFDVTRARRHAAVTEQHCVMGSMTSRSSSVPSDVRRRLPPEDRYEP